MRSKDETKPITRAMSVTIHCVSVFSFPVMFSVLRMICARISCSDMRDDMRDDMHSGAWYAQQEMNILLNISQVLLNISLLKSFLLMIYVFKWHNLTILHM